MRKKSAYKYNKQDKNDQLVYLPETERFRRDLKLSIPEKCRQADEALENDRKRKIGLENGMSKPAKKLKK